MGEGGFGGGGRNGGSFNKRIKEAKKLGFSTVFSAGNLKNLSGLFKG